MISIFARMNTNNDTWIGSKVLEVLAQNIRDVHVCEFMGIIEDNGWELVSSVVLWVIDVNINVSVKRIYV